MKIIDSQGKLFGRINILDFFVIILLLIIIRAFFLGNQLCIANKKALKLVRQEEELKAASEAEARQRTEAQRKRTIEDRLVIIGLFQEKTDEAIRFINERLEALEGSARRSLNRKGVKKNIYP